MMTVFGDDEVQKEEKKERERKIGNWAVFIFKFQAR